MWKGHSRKIKMKLRSTKFKIQDKIEEADKFVGETEDIEGCYHVVYDLDNDMDQKMYTDQPDRFLVQSY